MENKSTKYKVRLGLFVLVGFALFVVAIFWIGRQKNLFQPTFRLSASFKNVSGLQAGNNVRFSGINVGTVDGIQILTDTSVLVEMIIDKKVQRFIKRDAVVSIGSEGFIGDKVAVIGQGSVDSVAVRDGFRLVARNPIETDQILASLKTTGENASIITDQLAEVAYKINNGQGTLGRLLSDPHMANSLNATLDNLQTGSKSLSENMEAAKHSVLLRGYFKKKEKEQQDNADTTQVKKKGFHLFKKKDKTPTPTETAPQ